MDMVMVSKWCSRRNAPVADALAASDLQGAFDGRNLAGTLDRARKRHGLSSASCVGTMTDGASACSGSIQEGRVADLFAQGAAEGDVHKSREGSCGVARPRGGLHWPPTLQLDSIKIGNRATLGHELKTMWIDRCGYLDFEYDRWLGKLPEPTEAKWGVMYDICFPCFNLFDFAPHQAGVGMTRFKEFLQVCLELLREWKKVNLLGPRTGSRPRKAGNAPAD
eukprot:6181402-Pleurochrysis_carterae.AAC.1